MRRATVIAPLLALGACLPLTFSHEAVIDFDRYRSVAVHVEYRAGCELAAGGAGGGARERAGARATCRAS